ncbi:hypothetical protein AUC43_15185 [Hymenobacter sedentarius]|uniref:RiboL-PSP-HEPN domain-containing protein n=2 Tax=Hymenobacter sedentarius TaxID=1411621 RepID=A0A0U3T0D6_9BACT|nr:hypothetical protein AUC43_15185 [Hymenobacter sedentarius]
MIMAFTVLTDFDDFAYDVEEYFDLNGQIIGELPEADAVTLKELIASGEPPALLDALHSQIRNSLDLKDWRSAAIDSAILLETWLTPKLKAAYTAKGLKNREIKERFKTGELHLPISLGDILVTLIPDALGFNFDGSDEYEALKTKTITLRNHIVHGRKHFVTKAEAELSYASVNKAIEFIEKATAN